MKNEELVQQVSERAKLWLSDKYDENTRKEVQALLDSEDKTDLIDAFYKDLEFGTGGMRGIMGAGTNKVNKYTFGTATQGLCNYILKEFADLEQPKVVIGHDCRNNSRYFAETCADIFSANGIKVYLFDSLRPTPEISYTIRKFGCQSGIIITASHNPPKYNGYKVYWNDGAQIIAPHDRNIIAEVNRVSIDDIKFEGNKDLIEIIGEKVDKQYIDEIQTLLLSKDAIGRQHNIGIVYTPIHGTGIKLIPDALKAAGFTNIINVPEQDVISGDFPTVASPNPEDPAAMKMAVDKAIATNAEVAIGTDPDSDRIGIAVKDNHGNFVLLNGNQLFLVLIYYILERKQALGQLTGNEFTVRTIVTTELAQAIVESFGVEMFETYTGFKWIAAVIRELEGKRKYIGGGEESYGFMAQDFVRDKDAVSAALLVSELTAWAKDNNKSIFQILQEIYLKYGFSKERGISVVKEGRDGALEIEAMMKQFRENPPLEIAGSKVVLVNDFATLKSKDLLRDEESTLRMPTTANVLQYYTADKSKISIRPSGTEPKIKFYIETRHKLESLDEYDQVNQKLDEKINLICRDLGI